MDQNQGDIELTYFSGVRSPVKTKEYAGTWAVTSNRGLGIEIVPRDRAGLLSIIGVFEDLVNNFLFLLEF